MRLIHWPVILLLTCFINSCGLVNTIYNNAPEVMSWWLDDYFDFTQAQKNVLNPALINLHSWHRQHQLPDYVEILKGLQNNVSKTQMSPTEACGTIDQIKASYSQLQLESIPIIIEVAPLLTDKQLHYFQTKLEKRTQKWKDEWLQDSPEAQLEARLEKAEDLAEKMYGNLDESQHNLLKQNLADSAIKPALTYAEILRRNEDVYQILTTVRNSSLNPAEKSQLVKEGFARLQKSPNPTYQAYANQIVKRSCEVISNLHASTTSKQKQHAKDYLEGYITQFSSLSSSPIPAKL